MIRVVIVLAAMVFAACTIKTEVKTTDSDLSPSEIEEGWHLLFDGNTMEGWKIFKGRKNNSWEVVDGTLHCKAPMEEPGIDNERSDIITTESYENFELSLEWKIAPEANSGVMFRVTEEFEQTYLTGPEYQIIDDVGYPGNLKEENKTASCYDMYVATNKDLKPVGEWNHTKLIVNGNHIEHWLNGAKTLEYEMNSEDWQTRKNNSKWKDAAGFGVPTSGAIALQDHGSEVWFRKIKIRRL